MDRIKKARGAVRTAVTKAITNLEWELAKDNPDSLKLKTLLQSLDRNAEKMTELDANLIEALLDGNVSEEAFAAENDSIQEYLDNVAEARIKTTDHLHPVQRPTSPQNSVSSYVSASGTKRTFKLPKIEIRKFSGGLVEWLGWWAQFKKIDSDQELHAADKFQYLVQSTKQGSRARDLVDRYPQSEENYPKVIKALKERFGKPKLLKQVYVRELISMIVKKSREKNEFSNLSNLFDKLDSHLRSLESLGVTVEQMGEFLFPMVESCLPDEILVAWQRSSYYGQDGSLENPPKSEMNYLLDFLKREIDNEEQRSLAKSGFGFSSVSSNCSSKKKNYKTDEDEVPTAAGLFNGDSKVACIFCENPHDSTRCNVAQTMTIGVRRDKLKGKKACFLCFRLGHWSKSCKSSIKCSICGKKHQALLCTGTSETKPKAVVTQDGAEKTHSYLNCSSEIVLQTLMVKVKNQETGVYRKIRVLIDNGSQRSYISNKAIEDIGLQSFESVTLNHMLFGGTQVSGKVHNSYQVNLTGMQGSHTTTMKMLDQTKICGSIPRVVKGGWMAELKRNRIFISDLSEDNDTEVEMLIGADNLGKISTGKVVHLTNGLTATETTLGWTLMGEFNKQKSTTLAMNVITASITSINVSDLWSLETIGIRDPAEVKSKEDKERAAKEYFMQTVSQNEEGRYSVSLPWIDGMKAIPSNRSVAEKRLNAATSKIVTQGKYTEYDDIFNAWEKEGIISEDKADSPKIGCHYLPHRPVFKPESKSTPIRPVFDASCKVGRSPSLNDCMEKGPNLLELIPSLLIRFRLGKIGVSSDIRKAFLMVQVNEEDRHSLRFLWWEDSERKNMKVFRHNRVVFGMNCSPFLLGAVIEYHLGKIVDHRQPIAMKLVKSLYVDNVVTSVNIIEEYDEFKETSTEIMLDGKMELRQWECTGDGSSQVVTSVLGLKWDKQEDNLFCDVIKADLPPKITKRTILSEVQKIFDPLGFLCPTLIIPKIMLQSTWVEKKGWDEEVHEEMRLDFHKWFTEIVPVLDRMRIPRNVTGGQVLADNAQLHMFCDASKAAYATVVYLRVETENGVSVQLLQAKSRVTPAKPITIPRLELLSCNIGARMISTVKEALDMTSMPTTLWSDSTTALAWIRRNDDWGTFVGNRVREICSLTNTSDWRHVPGSMNPADLPSRGCRPLELLKSKWWEGPAWLKLDASQWPSGEGVVDEDLVLQEKKKSSIMTMTSLVNIDNHKWLMSKGSFLKNVRIFAFVLRFVKKLRKMTSENGTSLSTEEVCQAEVKMFQLIQDVFPDDQNVIAGLRVMRDKDGIIRVMTKLTNRQDSEGFLYPILLPTTHPLVDQLIREEHQLNGHAGAQYLMGKLREKCWIIQARRSIKKVINSCVICRRFTTRSPTVPPSALPENRVKDARAFEITGVDLAGPLVLRNKTKSYYALFTCAVYRCIHLELLESLSTEDFLMAFVRFCKRKRRPTTVYSDNGTNFVGTVNLFKFIDWGEVERRTQQYRIQWRFNPPSAPWWGGWWERLIQSTKAQLKRMLGFGKFTYVQLETALCEVEATINNRPLTFVSDDQDDLIPLTPAMFIHDLPETDCPEAKLLKIQGLQSKVKNMRQLGDELRSRFRKEYLAQLVQRGKDKKHETFRVGDVVLVGSDNQKRIQWPMARIVALLPGKDGICRVAKVRTMTGELTRPLQRLYPLEVSSQEEAIPVSEKVKEIGVQEKRKVAFEVKDKITVHTRAGRKVRVPIRYGQC